ncbi:MAG: AraC family transcriptional regulator [Opitutaceae bacterium]|jgi:AraC family transcriptional regulator of arabinose operon|nr:AraC family transcriptional regulator [Opitutaceae bacterium]
MILSKTHKPSSSSNAVHSSKKSVSFFIQSPTKDADFFSGHHIYTNRECRWEGNRPQDWSLILTLGGHGEISTKDGMVENITGALTLISPDHPHTFYTDANWIIRWVHFLMRPHMPSKINWPEPVRGIYQVHLGSTDLKACAAALEEATRLDCQRAKGWYPLAYNLTENVLLRGNNKDAEVESVADTKIIFAQKLLLESPDNAANMDTIAKECGMSRSSFYAHFKQAVGISPREYREILLLRRAQMLLDNSHLTISEIAGQIGMPSIYYFSTRFKKFSGMSPSAYRQNKARVETTQSKRSRNS